MPFSSVYQIGAASFQVPYGSTKPEKTGESGALSVDEAAKWILPVDDNRLVAGKDELLKKFDGIFK